MNLRALQYLVYLDEERHFGRAAERCNVTQSTLSIQLKKLEEYLGLRLFERSCRHVQPTADGDAVIAYARRVIAMTKRIKRVALRHQAAELSHAQH
ncbi:MAG: LysR family transcriptional regulator [Nevskia sp.]|nr:LysR family transcriptional regulator [Nevskia sp.]